MRKKILKSYAELIVKKGLALRKNQAVVIRADAENAELVAMIVQECYKNKASRVIVRWGNELVDRAQIKYGKVKELSKVLPFEEAFEQWQVDDLPAALWVDSDDPDALKGLDPVVISTIAREKMKVVAKYRNQRDTKFQWCICAAPSKAWAKKVFPDLPVGKAVEKLWEAILSTSRAIDGNGVENWTKHDKDLKAKCAYLNSLNLRKLHYTSSNGTDLTVGLIPGVIFQGGGESTITGDYYHPNIPSEECFTSPMKGEAEGIVYSAKPLVYRGQFIDNFYFKFHEGKVVECHAEVGEEALKSILTLDEGAGYLGECALVPYDSPINNTGLLFYNTLFDENAACHLAIGRGFLELYPGFENLSEDEIHAKGINKSISHVDFMIGSKDLNIVGIDDKGNEIQIFKDGNWAPEIAAKLA